jgi:REP element-mobilizing transposase RayT
MRKTLSIRRPAPRTRESIYPDDTPVHAILTTQARAPVFANPHYADMACWILRQRRDLLAFCLLPDHLHLLVRDGTQLVARIGAFKAYSTKLLRDLGHLERVWQHSFWDHVLGPNERLRDVAGHILASPVRAGLVDDPALYRYQSSVWTAADTTETLPLDAEIAEGDEEV